MSDEDILRQQFGNKRPFRAPEDFFDNFAEQMMQQLPEAQTVEMTVEKSRKGVWARLRPMAIAASAALLMAVGATMLWNNNSEEKAAALAAYPTTQQSQDYTIDQMADYAMLDNQDFYNYLADL